MRDIEFLLDTFNIINDPVGQVLDSINISLFFEIGLWDLIVNDGCDHIINIFCHIEYRHV